MLVCHLTESPERIGKFVKLKMTTFISREKIIILSFDRKSGKTWQIREICEIENGNFYFTRENVFCRLTENTEKLGNF